MDSSTITWILIAIAFTTYFIVSYVYKKLGVRNIQQGILLKNGLCLLNLKHLLGIVFFGILFYVAAPDSRHLIDRIEVLSLPMLILFLGIAALSAYISHLSIKKYRFEDVGLGYHDARDAWLYFIIRFTFLLSYEFFFRGILFYMFLINNNTTMAIVYTTISYVIIHLFDSRKEMIGAIPFGIILCLFTYVSGSIWYAFLIHMSLSAVYEISMFYYQTLKTSRS